MNRSRVPNIDIDPEHYKFLDDLDKRRLKPIDLVTSTAQAMPDVSAVSDTPISSVATTGASNSSPYGFTTKAQADAIVAAINDSIARQADIITALNALVNAPDNSGAIHDVKTQLNALIAEMQTRGAMEKP